MRLIDAEALASDLMERWNTADEDAEKEIIAVLAKIVTPIVVGQPTVDAVEVVRCRDCKYGLKVVSPITAIFCTRFGEKDMADDDYCSYGERGEVDE